MEQANSMSGIAYSLNETKQTDALKHSEAKPLQNQLLKKSIKDSHRSWFPKSTMLIAKIFSLWKFLLWNLNPDTQVHTMVTGYLASY